MRSEAPALLPIFRSQAQGEILALLLLHPDQEFSLTDLSRRVNAPLTSIHREVERLAEGTLVAERQMGRNRMVRANPAHPAREPLTRLLELSFGPQHVVADEFAAIQGKPRDHSEVGRHGMPARQALCPTMWMSWWWARVSPGRMCTRPQTAPRTARSPREPDHPDDGAMD